MRGEWSRRILVLGVRNRLRGTNPRQGKRGNQMSKWMDTLREDEAGSVAAEYGLLIAGIAVVMGAAAALLGGRIAALFDSVL